MVWREYGRYALTCMLNGNDWILEMGGFYFLLLVLEYSMSDA